MTEHQPDQPRESLLTCIVLIPKRRTTLENAPVLSFEHAVLRQFGGHTRALTEAVGAWMDDSGRLYEDPSFLYLVAIPRHRRAAQELSCLVRQLAGAMGEKCMLVLLPLISGELIWSHPSEEPPRLDDVKDLPQSWA